METPPRAWGRPARPWPQKGPQGNTPTGVGKTKLWPYGGVAVGKHPHGRGEDRAIKSAVLFKPETPPRAWGRPSAVCKTSENCRNTPTGVGKTFEQKSVSAGIQKHPHGRGEDLARRALVKYITETPPRAWGRLQPSLDESGRERNTPTGVGKTWIACRILSPTWKHPHGRGEDEYLGGSRETIQETPPRAWGRPYRSRHPKAHEGNTPTGVGKTS